MGKLPRLFGVLSIALVMAGCQSTSEPQKQLVSEVEQDLQEQIDAEKVLLEYQKKTYKLTLYSSSEQFVH